MAQMGRGRGFPDEDRLPWLDDPAPPPRAPGSGRRLLGAMVFAFLAIALLIAGTLWWVRHRAGPDGQAQLILAPPGPYKVKPSDPGGMAVEGEGYASYQASEGVDPDGRLDLGATPEAPVKRGPAPATAAPAEPVMVPGTGTGGTIQLGAFSTERKANDAWKALAQRFRWLEPFEPLVLPAMVGEATVYRLRTHAGRYAARICGRLKVAGETCQVVG